MPPQKTNYYFNERGYSLIIVILALAVTSIIGMSLYTITINAHKITSNEHADQSVYYIAEAGLVETKAQLNLTNNNPKIISAIDETKEEFKDIDISEDTITTEFNHAFLEKVLATIPPIQI